MGEHIEFSEGRRCEASAGSAGLATQLPGCATTVGNLSAATGGTGAGHMVETDI